MVKNIRYTYLLILIVTMTMFMSCSSPKPDWHTHSYNGNFNRAKESILDTKDINSVTTYGENSLLWASSIGDADLVNRLLALGADVNIQNKITGETPLIAASRNGHIEAAKALIKSGANKTAIDNTGSDAISAAIGSGNINIIDELNNAGIIIDNKKANSMILNAASSGDIKAVKKLLGTGASINTQTNDGGSLLMEAARSGNAELVKLLINLGAKIDSKDSAGRTALILASQSGFWECCEVLIVSGSDINTKDTRGNTPLMWAIIMGHNNVANQYLQRNVDLTHKNSANKNALYLAAYNHDVAKSILRINSEIPEVTVEADNYSELAFSYKELGDLLVDELQRDGVDKADIIIQTKLAYQYAAKHFDSTANQYVDLASSLRTKQVLSVVGAALLNAASQTAASYDAKQQAHRNAEMSALRSAARGGSGKGVGYGISTYSQITPGTSNWDAAKISDAKAGELIKLAEACRQKADCYDKAKIGQDKTCTQKTGSNL